MPARLNIIGQRFGRLKVIAEAEGIRRPGQRGVIRRSVCLCDCGTVITVLNGNLKRNPNLKGTQSCGCLMLELLRERNFVHGHAIRENRSPEYRSWMAMIERCQNPEHTYFRHYGGRGITVCERWQDFQNFYADMGPRPIKTTLERLDNSKGYEKSNCVWASQRVQSRNRRSNLIITLQGITAPFVTHCERLGLNSRNDYAYVFGRMKHGWSVERAFLEPKRKSNPSDKNPPVEGAC